MEGPTSFQDGQQKTICSRTRCFWIIIIVSFITIVGVGLGVFLASNSKGETSDGTNNSAKSKQELELRLGLFQSQVAQISTGSSFLDLNSPQSKALDWLVYRDETIPTKDYNSTRLFQRYAMMVLFYSCGGSAWVSFITPLEKQVDVHECDFRGVKCNDRDEIVSIDLAGEQVSGKIPSEIVLLTNLQELDLSNNYCIGPIPESIYKLSNLEYLALERNDLSSTISSDIGRLSRLTYLSMSSNSFTGTIPDTLSLLTNLRDIRLGVLGVTGPLLDFALHWPQIEYMYINESSFNGTIPSQIHTLTRLVHLEWGNNEFVGTIPTDWILSLSDLQYLSFGNEGLAFDFPTSEELSNSSEGQSPWSKLKDIKLQNSADIRGSLPSAIGQLSILRNLIIIQTGLGGTIPSELGQLTNRLEAITLESNQLSGTVPDFFSGLSNLRLFDIKANAGLMGTLPTSLCTLPSVSILYDCTMQCSCCLSECNQRPANRTQ